MNGQEFPRQSEDQQRALKEQQQQQQQEAMRGTILEKILTLSARERLERIAIVKPEKARRLEDYLIQAARSGQLRPGTGDGGRISEDNLVDFLDRIGEQEAASTSKITFQRRRDFDDDDDDY